MRSFDILEELFCSTVHLALLLLYLGGSGCMFICSCLVLIALVFEALLRCIVI